MPVDPLAWEQERQRLLNRRISDLGLSIEGSPLERLVRQLHEELAARGLSFFQPVYLSDEWGCPDGTPLIGAPFYLADERLARIEEESSMMLESESEMMRFLRHEAGHAYNYAFRFYDSAEWHQIFGPYSRPYRDRFRVDPLSRDYVRHMLGWYAQKHPDEDFAETFAVWLTPDIDWRKMYAGWPVVLRKLEYVDGLMKEVAGQVPEIPSPTEDDVPVNVMDYTVAEHYLDDEAALPLSDESHFDGDLRALFSQDDAEEGDDGTQLAAEFLRSHRRELVGRVAYWTGEATAGVRALIDLLTRRADVLQLRSRGRESTLLIEITAFSTAVMMNYRYTHALGGSETSVELETE
jgi:hypothetical protein